MEVSALATLAPCPIVRFNALTGGKYKLRILYELRRGPRRYSEIQRALRDATGGASITPRVLSRELRDLVGAGLLGAQAVPGGAAARRVSPHQRRARPARVMRAICRWAGCPA